MRTQSKKKPNGYKTIQQNIQAILHPISIEDIRDFVNKYYNYDYSYSYSEKHNQTHKNCLWELPYAKALILPHNIDLMHQERNVEKSIISMCLDVTSFSKDNMNARKD